MDDDVIATEWNVVLERWDDPRAHTTFIELCRLSNVLPRAASYYRAIAEDDPKAKTAAERLEAIRVLAMTVLEGTRTTPTKGLPKWFVVSVAIVFGSLVAYSFMRAFG